MPSVTGSSSLTPALSTSPRGLRLFRSVAFVLMSCSLAAGCGGPTEDSQQTDPLEPTEEPGSPVQSFAQSCNISWQGDRQFGTSKADELNSVWVDENGYVYTTGFENGTVGQTNIEPSGNARGVVRKLWPNGTLAWQKNIETSGTDTVEHLIGASNGRVRVVGRTTGVVSGNSNGGQFDLFAMELDGTTSFTYSSLQTGDARPQHPLKLASTSEGNLVFAGYEDLFVDHQQVMDSENSFLSSFVPAPAQERWRWRSESLENPDRITGMTLNAPANDEIYVSGFKFFADAESFGGAFVRRYDLSGTQLWATQIGFVATEVDELLVSPTGELFAAGSTQLPIGGEGRGLADAYITSIDRATGAMLWTSKAGTTEHDFVTAFAQGPNGDLYVAGDTFGAFGDFTNQGERDLFVLRFSSTGELLSIWQRGTAARDHAAGLWVDACNNIYLGGFTEGSLVNGTTPRGRDAFLLKVTMP